MKALGRPAHVLVLEDEPRFRAFMVEVLQDMECTAHGCANAAAARVEMERRPPDILVLDLNLPVEDGLSFLESFRAEQPAAPVVVVTGFGDLAAAQRAIRLGVADFLTKPCHLGEIERAIDRARRRVVVDAEAAPMAEDESSAGARSLADAERAAIRAALRAHDGNRTATAAALGISRRALYDKIERHRRDGHELLGPPGVART